VVEMMEEYYLWNIHSKIIASKHKQKILSILETGPQTPLIIAEILHASSTYTSTTLSQLVELKMIICLTPDRRKGKLFGLSGEGRDYLNFIKQKPVMKVAY